MQNMTAYFENFSKMMIWVLTASIVAWFAIVVVPHFIKHFRQKEFVLKEYFPWKPLNITLATITVSLVLGWMPILFAYTCSDEHRFDPSNVCQDVPSTRSIQETGHFMSSLHYAGDVLAVMVLLATAAFLFWLIWQIISTIYLVGKIARYYVRDYFRQFKVRIR